MTDIKQKEDFLVEQVMNPEGEEESKEEEVKNTKRSKTNKDPKSKEAKQAVDPMPELEDIIDYENKSKEAANARMKHLVELLQTDRDYINRFQLLTKKKVIRHHLLLKCLFYLLEYDKDKICC